jgi:2-polyprenyl-3-methyl-5-hydroxy-6-metoxy-1,4-benzoquinol methylase
MIEKLEEKFVNKMPDRLFCFIANSYFLIHPKQENIHLLPKGNSWLLQKRDYQLLFPKSARRIFRPEPYERYFRIASDETVLDVGANIGDPTIPFAKKAKEVVAIEAEPENIAYLRMNVTNNCLHNVHIVGNAVWNCRKTLTLYFKKNRSLA